MERKCFWNVYFLLFFIFLLSEAVLHAQAEPEHGKKSLTPSAEPPEKASSPSGEPPEGTFLPSGEPDPDSGSSPSPAAEPPEGIDSSGEADPDSDSLLSPSEESLEEKMISDANQEDAPKLPRLLNKMIMN